MSAAQIEVPVATGSSSAVTVEAGAFRVTHARFPARGEIPAHHHDRACIAVMLAGSFDLKFPGGPVCDCLPGTLTVEPVGDTHCNCMGTAGAEVLVVQPDPAARDLLQPVAEFLDGIRQLRHPSLSLLARRMAAEVVRPDAVTPMAIEGLALELLVQAARARTETDGRGRPAWLDRAEGMLRARFTEPLTVAEVAQEAGVHPAHLARTFRVHLHCSIGGFLRRLRVEEAATLLARSDAPIAQVAAAVGFADQSHLTRRFREQMGTTPERWRRIARR